MDDQILLHLSVYIRKKSCYSTEIGYHDSITLLIMLIQIANETQKNQKDYSLPPPPPKTQSKVSEWSKISDPN